MYILIEDGKWTTIAEDVPEGAVKISWEEFERELTAVKQEAHDKYMAEREGWWVDEKSGWV